jgi:hypothetical protein
MASQINMGERVPSSQKNGKAKNIVKRAPPKYTGRRPMRSESAPNAGVVKSPMKEERMTPV